MAVPNQSRRRNEIKLRVTDEVMAAIEAVQSQYSFQFTSDAANLMLERAAFGLAGQPATTLPVIRCSISEPDSQAVPV